MKQRWSFNPPAILKDADGTYVVQSYDPIEDIAVIHDRFYHGAEAILLLRRLVGDELRRIEADMLSPEIPHVF